ncbi:MAG: amidohydrolase family protein [Bdellovibrionales bacterium]|nr:amidohydrolase family protein [Bdellovibrionales bacterium]
MKYKLLLILISITPLANCVTAVKRDLPSFLSQKQKCYDRRKEPHTFIVDTHVHFRPFGGKAIPFTELNEYFKKTGVLFVNVYGIGQTLPVHSKCIYYLDCPGEPALPSIKNDFVNAANFIEFKPQGVHYTLSMTFPDLANPENIVDLITLYDKEYPKTFKWMGEVNLNKQALLNNHHQPASEKHIEGWKDFMQILKERNIPITIHSDLGNDEEPTKFLHLMEYVLTLYPENKIIWAHAGLSKELKKIDAAKHIQIMTAFLNKHPNLMLDISWRILEDNHFGKNRKLYVAFLNKYSNKILPGTDFVASRKKTFKIYKKELQVTSKINKYLNDEAFRNIALGNNYFRLMSLNYQAPPICKK